MTTSPVAAFTSGGPPRKMVPWSRHDDGLVAHRRDVGTAGRAGAEHRGQLGDALGGHARLVEEDAAEVVTVGEDLVLAGQERAAGVDEVEARQPVGGRDLLRPQVLLDRHRVVGAALDRRVVGRDDAVTATDPADAGDQPGAWGLVAVEPVGGQRRQLEEGRAGVEQRGHPVPRQQLAALDMALAGPYRTALGSLGDPLVQARPRAPRGGRGLP